MSQSIDIQTDSVLCLNEEVQTFDLIEYFEMEMQTDVLATKNQRIQTPMPVLVDAEAQSEEVKQCQQNANHTKTFPKHCWIV
jgi:hypothetical protein